MNGRHEIKIPINRGDMAQLRARLRAIARPDDHGGPDGCYHIRSLYFDSYTDRAVMEKLSGQSSREKFRIRYYNRDPSFMRLEVKRKAQKLTYKESAPITARQCEELLQGQYGCLKEGEHPLKMALYTKIHSQCLRPKVIVDYVREAYQYPAGNVRITFDQDIRTTAYVGGFLRQDGVTIPAAGGILMEIKFDGFLPGVMKDILGIGFRTQREFSKYVAARFV